MDMEQLLWVLVYAASVARNGTMHPHQAAQAAETATQAFRESPVSQWSPGQPERNER